MLRTKVTKRDLTEADLACPFPACEHSLAYSALKNTVSKASLDEYDNALTKNILTVSPVYITCLSSSCGLPFSTEDCRGSQRGKFKIACPYCDYAICMTCNRPWESHGTGSCARAKEKEDRETAEALEKMGAKSCPNCGVMIEKAFGCDHMLCDMCSHSFCWQCLVSYNANVPHAQGCIHGGVNVARQPEVLVDDHMTIAQIEEYLLLDLLE
ncbi:hypothetical protein ACN47E_008084 [Coniothyrium glycines]